jgi:hypothetical protein
LVFSHSDIRFEKFQFSGSIATQRPLAELKASQWHAALKIMVAEVVGEYQNASELARTQTTGDSGG